MDCFKSLKTTRTLIRRFITSDKADLIKLLSNKAVTQHLAFPEEILTKEGISKLLEMTINSYDTEKPLLSFAVTDAGSEKFVGVAGFHPLANEEIEILYALLPEFWGKGLSTDICRALTEYAFKKGYRTVVAPVTCSNIASIKVLDKNGFVNYGLKNDPSYKEQIYLYKKDKNTIVNE